MKRSSQPSSTTPGKRAGKTCRSGSRLEASNAKSRKNLFHFKPEKVNKFEYCNNLQKQNLFHNPVRRLKACLSNNLPAVCAMCMQIFIIGSLRSVSFSHALFFLCPLLPSACYAGYTVSLFTNFQRERSDDRKYVCCSQTKEIRADAKKRLRGLPANSRRPSGRRFFIFRRDRSDDRKYVCCSQASISSEREEIRAPLETPAGEAMISLWSICC